MKRLPALCLALGALLAAGTAPAETIMAGDVTAELGPSFFIDEAKRGGTDVSGTSFNLDVLFSGVVVGSRGSEITISGLGWASKAAGTTATEMTVTVTYLGGDGRVGGGDDVLIGSVTDALVFAGANEYVWRFDEPLVATIDGSNTLCRLHLTTGGSGSIDFKVDNGRVKLSVAGSSSGILVHNLARLRDVTASSNQAFAPYATDGVVGDDFKWVIPNGETVPASLDIAFPGPVEIGSYHLYGGANNQDVPRAWKLQYRLSGGPWLDVPGSLVADNTASEVNIILAPILVDELRLLITQKWGGDRPRIREWAVFGPNGGAGYPLGTGVTLNMARHGLTTADSNAPGNVPRLATDGYLGTRWVSGGTGPHTLEVFLREEIEIGSTHLYTGDGTPGSALADFELEFSREGTEVWVPVPGGSVSGNTDPGRVVPFSSPVLANRVRLTATNDGPVSVRELLVFPDNGTAGYAAGTDVQLGQPPPPQSGVYDDHFYRIRSTPEQRVLTADASGVSLVEPNHLDGAQVYQILDLAGSGHVRIFNRGTRNCLAVEEASLADGAAIVEEPYGAFPSQLWRVVDHGDGTVAIENVFSRMRMEASESGIVQRPLRPAATQSWAFDFLRTFPKKGMGGYPQLAEAMQASWLYTWGPGDPPTLTGQDTDFSPMQWGSFNWDPDGYQTLPITARFPYWRTLGYPLTLLGFNEPDGADQSNITVEKAIELWPRLMAAGVPLASPAAKGPTRPWMIDWMAEAEARGYRVDQLTMHTYPGPNPLNVIDSLEQFSADHEDRPVLLTEFGFVDWNQTGTWTENLLYNQMLELLWRLENSSDCKRYALFGFREDGNWPQPADPTGTALRTNWQYADQSFTPIGELYMGWDGDLTPNPDQPYIVHHRAFDMRVHNDGSSTVNHVNIRTGGASAQVTFESIGNGYYYLVSSSDGKRLRKTGPDAVVWAAAATTSTDAQWTWSLVETGWHLVSNRTGGNLRYTPAGGVHLGTAAGEYYHWFLVPPMNPVDQTRPAAPTGLGATASHQRVDLQWTGSISADTESYTLRRSTAPGGSYTTVATQVVSLHYRDTGLTNGIRYYYVVDTVDGDGQVGTSAEVSATPFAPDPVTYADWALVAFDGAPPGTDTSLSGNPDNDSQVNFAEFVFLLDPMVYDGADIGIDAESSGDIRVTFRVNRHATGITLDLGWKDDLAAAGSWSNASYSVISQTNIGEQVELEIQPDTPPPERRFFRIEARMD